MAVTLDSIVKSGLILAFIIPIFTYISVTVPTPTPLIGNVSSSTEYNITLQYNATANYISQHFAGSVNAISTLAFNQSGGFFASPVEYEAFAFVFDGLGQMLQNIVQLPILDAYAMQMFLLGMEAVVPPIVSGALVAGIAIMQAYLLFSLIMVGLGMLMKYNPRTG